MIVREKLGDAIFSVGDETLAAVLVRFLSERKQTVAIAESCTGGFLANEITNVPGASKMFVAGYVTYSNEEKIRTLGVSRESIEKFGAVSEQVGDRNGGRGPEAGRNDARNRHDRDRWPDRWQRGKTGRHSFRGIKFGESTDAMREVLFSNRSRNVQTTGRPARVRFIAEGAVALWGCARFAQRSGYRRSASSDLPGFGGHRPPLPASSRRRLNLDRSADFDVIVE